MSANRLSSWVWVGVAAAAAVFLAVLPKTTGRSDKPEAAKPAEKESAKRDKRLRRELGGPLTPVWDYFYPAEPPAPPAAGGGPPDWPAEDRWKERDTSIQLLIATVPDPVESGFGYLFDQVIEAVQRALETQGYVIDRAWLPWPRPGAKTPAERPHEKQPGLILFRNEVTDRQAAPGGRRPRQRLLALLLVGETATAGIHPAAFARALRLVWDCPARAREEETVRVLGPYFSGSQASLARALHYARVRRCAGLLSAALHMAHPGPYGGWLPLSPIASLSAALQAAGPRPIHVVCGSATSFNHEEFFNTWGSTERKDRFQSTIIPDFLIRRWVFKFLDNPADPTRGDQPATMLILQEANTGFGRYSDRQFGRTQTDGDKKRVFTIPFPLHISQLRASYTKAQLAQLESLGLPRPLWDLPFPTGEEDGRGAEPIPIQSPQMTTALNSLVVNNFVQTMAQKRSRYVCLIATDARDKVFLADLIRDRFPDVQLCTTMADLLYTHPDHRYALGSMVVGSTYPLCPGVQAWGDVNREPERRSILFANQSLQGCYNAILVHLAEANKAARPQAEAARLQAEAAMLDYGLIGKGRRETQPGIWISAVGQNGQLVPLYYASPEAIKADLQKLKEQQRQQAEQPVARRPAPPGEECQAKEQMDQYKFVYGRSLEGLEGKDLEAPEFRRGALPPVLWALLFAALTLTVCALGARGCHWVRRSHWEAADHRERLAAGKQRIDFSIGDLAVIVLYYWIAQLAVIPWHYPDERADWWPLAANLLVILASLTMIVVAWVSIFWVYCRGDTPAAAARSLLGKYAELLRDRTPLDGWLGRVLPRASAWLVGMELAVFVAGQAVAIYCLTHALGAFLSGPEAPTPQSLIYFGRLADASNGLSPLVPVFFLCAVFFAWGLFLVKKLHLASRHAVPCPFPGGPGNPRGFQRLGQLHGQVRNELMPPSTWQHHPGLCLLVLGLLVGMYVKLGYESVPPIDGLLFRDLTLAAFFAGSFLLIFTLCQVYLAWSKLRQLLRLLALMPMVEAFARLPEKVKSEDGHLFSLRPRDEHLTVVAHLFEALRRRFAAFRRRLRRARKHPREPQPVPLTQAARDFKAQFPKGEPAPLPSLFGQDPNVPRARNGPAPGADEDEQERLRCAAANKTLSETARKCLLVLHSLWPAHSMDEAFGGAPQEEKSGAAATPQGKAGAAPPFLSLPEGDPVREWARPAEDFVAAWVVRYLSQFFAQLRNLLTSLTVGSLLLILAAVTYPFRPQSLLLVVLTALTGAVAVFIVVFLVQVNRNELISRITRSTPNRFTPDLGFVHGATTYVLPIVGGLLVQFPFFASGLRSLFEPLLHVVR
jgi:hypothetical protein